MFPVIVRDASRREGNGARGHVANCTVAKRFDSISLGGRRGHPVPHRTATRGLNMIENLARSRAILPTRSLCSAIVLLSCVSFLFGGCSIRKRPSVPWATAVQVRPAVQPRPATVSTVSDDPVPELRLELPPFPPRLFYVRIMPPRPRASMTAANGAYEP